MENNNRYLLRVSDFKKMVRYIVGYVIINLAVFGTLIFLLEGGILDKKIFPLEIFIITFFIVFSVGFIFIQKKNAIAEEVIIDSASVHTNRFGSLFFRDILAYRIFKKKRQEDIILILQDQRKIAFGPVDFRSKDDKEIYNQFKESISKKVPKKEYQL